MCEVLPPTACLAAKYNVAHHYREEIGHGYEEKVIVAYGCGKIAMEKGMERALEATAWTAEPSEALEDALRHEGVFGGVEKVDCSSYQQHSHDEQYV